MKNIYSQTIEQQWLTNRYFLKCVCILRLGAELTTREIIREQRRRVRSANPAERLAASLLLPMLLRECLAELDDAELGQLVEEEVWANLNALAPESTICIVAADRLRSPFRTDD